MSATVLDSLAAAYAEPSQPSWREGGRAWSRGDLLAAAERTAAAVRAAGATPESLWRVRGATSAAAFVGGLGVRLAGAVPVLVAPDGQVPAAGEAALGADLSVLAVDVLGEGPALPRGTAWVRSTGGTTGRPRLVAFTEAQTLAGAHASVALLALEPGQTVASTVPAWTAFGWNSAALVPLLAGASVVALPATAPRDLLDLTVAPRWVVTTGPLVRALARLRASVERAERFRILVAGGPYPVVEAACLVRHGIDVIDRYGATEAGPIAQAAEPLGPLRIAPGVSVAFEGSPARVVVRGPSVALGYVGTDEPPFRGTFRTPDVAEAGADGTFRLLGRSDRRVKRMGRLVDLARVERVVAGTQGVLLARVRVEPGALDVDLVAEVVPLDAASFEARAALARIRSRLEPWEAPTRMDVHASAPPGAEAKWACAGEAS